MGGRNPVDLLVMIGDAVFLGGFGTGVALAVRHPAFRWFQVSALAQPVLLAAFGIGWALNPEAMFESWPLVCVLLALSLGTCALIGFLTAAIAWWVWFRSPSAGRSM